MYLTRHLTTAGTRWALDGYFLPEGLTLDELLRWRGEVLSARLAEMPKGEPAIGALLAPIEATQEVWAAGVTYLRSKTARMEESDFSATA